MGSILDARGPFGLPATQRGKAEAQLSNTVTLVLDFADQSSVAVQGEHPSAISTQMTASVARDLAIRLWLAADRSEWLRK